MAHQKAGDLIHGFIIKNYLDLPEFAGEGVFLEHQKTGCQVFHLLRDDPENLFSFIFATPAHDNTGVAHILEHSVLSGSQNFPIKDPFLALMKGSVNTFLNAMTYPEKTVFPASSTVEKDYFNLMEVYGDSVFFPLLKEEIFMQEGHRLELEEAEGEAGAEKEGPSIAGVVYSEMQGAYSSHETIVNEWSYRSLFPDTPYQFDSGGEPEAIPRLSYEDFTAYHRRYYHPSNCRIFLYGNIPTEKQLAFLEEKLFCRFPEAETGTAREKVSLPFQKPWTSPREFFLTSPLDDEDDSAKSTVTINWKTHPITDARNLLAMEMLGEILLGNVGCPLYKAVVESGLGEDLAPSSGLDTEIRESVFTLGLRGTLPEKKDEFEKLVLTTLDDLVRRGIPGELVQGAFHQIEFRHREIRGGAPFGLRLMDRALRGWLHGADPWETLGFSEALEDLKKACRENPEYFENLIEEAFLKNPHRSLLVVSPDPEHNKIQEARREEFIHDRLTTLGSRGLEELKQKNRRFADFQSREDSPEDKAKIPVLHREDLPRDISLTGTLRDSLNSRPFYIHDFFTNGIVYLDLAFDVRGLSKRESSLLPLLSRLLCSSGIPGLSYDQLALKLSLLTGGLYTFQEASPVIGRGGETREFLFFRLKLLEKDLRPARSLLQDILLRGQVADKTRIKDLLLEQRNDFRSSLLPMGHSLCALRAAARLNPLVVREEVWRGVEQYLFLNRLAESLAGDGGASPPDEAFLSALGEELLQLREKLICRNRLWLNVTGQSSVLPALREEMGLFLDALPGGEAFGNAASGYEADWEFKRQNEGLIFPSAVGFTARVMPGAMAGTEAHSRELLLAHFLKTARLWEEVRMKGGAYGVSASANGAEGLFSFTSYRDPDPARTYGVFRDSLSFLADHPVPPDELEKTIIAVVGRDTKPLSPGEKSMMGFRRDLYGITDDIRRKNRERVLAAVPEDISRAAGELSGRWTKGVSVFLAGEEMARKIETAGTAGNFSRLELPV